MDFSIFQGNCTVHTILEILKMLKSIPQTPTRIFFFPQFSKNILSYPWRTRQNFFYSMKTKYFQKKNSHKGKNQDLTKNTHFCVFSKMHIFAYAILCLNFFFFNAIKKNIPSSPWLRSLFWYNWWKIPFSCWCLGYGFQHLFGKKMSHFKKVLHFAKKTTTRENAPTKNFVFIFLT